MELSIPSCGSRGTVQKTYNTNNLDKKLSSRGMVPVKLFLYKYLDEITVHEFTRTTRMIRALAHRLVRFTRLESS